MLGIFISTLSDSTVGGGKEFGCGVSTLLVYLYLVTHSKTRRAQWGNTGICSEKNSYIQCKFGKIKREL